MSEETYTISIEDIFSLLFDLSASPTFNNPSPLGPPFHPPPSHIYPAPTNPVPTETDTASTHLRRLAVPSMYCPPAERTLERFQRIVARVWRIILILRRAKGNIGEVEVWELLVRARGWMWVLADEVMGEDTIETGLRRPVVREVEDGLWGLVELWGGVKLAVRG